MMMPMHALCPTPVQDRCTRPRIARNWNIEASLRRTASPSVKAYTR